MDDNEVGLASPSKVFNDLKNMSGEWIHVYDDELKHVIGKIFDILIEGSNFYKIYAHNVSFSVRSLMETKNKYGLKWKYFLCLKEGLKEEKKL